MAHVVVEKHMQDCGDTRVPQTDCGMMVGSGHMHLWTVAYAGPRAVAGGAHRATQAALASAGVSRTVLAPVPQLLMTLVIACTGTAPSRNHMTCRMFTCDTGGSLTSVLHLYHYRVRHLSRFGSLPLHGRPAGCPN